MINCNKLIKFKDEPINKVKITNRMINENWIKIQMQQLKEMYEEFPEYEIVIKRLKLVS